MAGNKKNEKQLFDTLAEDQKDFFIHSLEKKVRNINKKLKEIKQLEGDKKEGKELKDAQLSKISSKAELQAKIKEQESIARVYLEARAENLAEGESTAAVKDTVNKVIALFFAAQHATATLSHPSLIPVFQNVFQNTSTTRVADATEKITTLIADETFNREVAVVVAKFALGGELTETFVTVLESGTPAEPETVVLDFIEVNKATGEIVEENIVVVADTKTHPHVVAVIPAEEVFDAVVLAEEVVAEVV